MFETIDLFWLLAFFFIGSAAGFVDAVAGGGGLITVPFLLASGMPPIAVLATNKLQGAVGTFVATLTYWRKGLIDLRLIGWALLVTFAGAYLGSLAVKQVDPSALSNIVPFALLLIALYFLLAPKLTDEDKARRLSLVFLPIVCFAVGFYDGIFGPGTGSFFTIACVALFGFGLTRATANTKALNLTSNAASLALFIPAGDVIWPVALTMALGQLFGGYVGAITGMRHGAKFIRPMIVVMTIAMAIRLLWVN